MFLWCVLNMIKVVYFSILLIAFICVLKNNESKLVSSIIAIGGFSVFAGNNYNSDYNMYLFSMLNGDYDRYEIGYKLYYYTLKNLGIKDYQFTLVITFFLLSIVGYISAKKITTNLSAVMLLLISAELFIGTVQIRTLIAEVFLLAAAAYYPSNKKMAMLYSIISASFQMVALFYVPFFFVGLIKDKKYIPSTKRILANDKNKYSLIGIFLLMYTILLLLNNLSDINIPLMIVSAIGRKYSFFEHVTYYFGGTAWGSLLFVALYFVNIMAIAYFKAHSRTFNDSYNTKYGEVVMNLNVYASLSLPFLFVDMNFYRLFRILNLLNFVYFASILSLNSKHHITKKHFKMISVLCCNQVVWIINYLYRVPEIYNDIFKYNLWW